MKFESRYSAPIRPILRIPAVLIGAIGLLFGVVYLICGDIKLGLPGTLFGLMFLTAGIKGKLPNLLDSEEREKYYEKQISEGKSVTRRMCLLSLGGLVVVIAVLTSIFLTTEVFSFGWWLAIAFSVFSSVSFYLSSTILLQSKGFHPLLAFTVIVPIVLLVIGAITPKKFEQMYIA